MEKHGDKKTNREILAYSSVRNELTLKDLFGDKSYQIIFYLKAQQKYEKKMYSSIIVESKNA